MKLNLLCIKDQKWIISKIENICEAVEKYLLKQSEKNILVMKINSMIYN